MQGVTWTTCILQQSTCVPCSSINNHRGGPAAQLHAPQHATLSVLCQAGKGQAYFDKYKANRQRHAGVLLPAPPPGPGVPHINTSLLDEYLQQELWAYTFGDPSPHSAPHMTPHVVTLDTVSEPGPAGTASPTPQDPASAVGRQSRDKAQPADAGSVKGAIIPAPDLTPSVPVRGAPAMPVQYDRSLAQVHVFWDLASKHPGAADPRVVAERLRRLAACFGNVAGLYAYALRKDWNWVPQHFLQYRQETVEPDDGRHRCPVCGVGRRTLTELQAHVKAVHPNSTALLSGRDNSAPDAGMATYAPRAAGRAGAADKTALRQSGAGGTASSIGPSSVGSGIRADAGAPMRNTSRRTVGKVARYHTARGKVVVPPSGDQLSLKYCLMQEGWEARIVQNAAEAESVALASGMGRLLDRVRRGEAGTAPGEKLLVLVVSEDESRLQQPLVRLRGIGGAATLAVRQGTAGAAGGKDRSATGALTFRGADLVLPWQEVVAGRYQGT